MASNKSSSTFATIESRPGTRVELAGLSTVSMNGRRAIVSDADFKLGRLIVSLESTPKKRVKVKPENLLVLRLPPPTNAMVKFAALQQHQLRRCKVVQGIVNDCYEVLYRSRGATGRFKRLGSPSGIFQLPQEATVHLIWWDPACDIRPPKRPISASEHLGEHSTGTLEFTYWDPCSLAIELYTLASCRTLDDYISFDGGLLRAIGETEIFGNAILHFIAAGSCCPTPPTNATVHKWSQTVPVSHMKRLMKSKTTRSPSGGVLKVECRSMAACLFLRLLQSAGASGTYSI